MIGESGTGRSGSCLLYTSDAADERSSVDLGGRRIIKKKKRREVGASVHLIEQKRELDTCRELYN